MGLHLIEDGRPPSSGYCRACNKQLRLVEDSLRGELFICDDCKITLEVDRAHASIIVDHEDGPAATTVNGGPKP